MPGPRAPRANGFSLVEVVVSLALLVTLVAGSAQLLLQSTAMMREARRAPVALAAAQGKIEQLRALAWTFDAAGRRVSDEVTDTSTDPPASSGGTGLRESPAGALDTNTAGWVDYLDQHARSLGGGSRPRAGTAYVRRWAVKHLPTSLDVLGLHVCVSNAARAAAQRDAADVCISTLRGRR
jgi:prepilin-type N-terminal cleavage/methylation domain-containing protein